MTCKICHSPTTQVFSKTILNKYPSSFYQCSSCRFVQTDEPVWLEEAYSNAITTLDIGLIDRNLALRDETIELIDACFPEAGKFLDYAGGYGMFVRLMRDKGLDFYRQDVYCENLFAKYFDIEDVKINRFDVVTAFEVFEHFKDPMTEIAEILKYSDTIIFSTKLLPQTVKEISEWWYLSTETGQHVAFYDPATLSFIARHFKKEYYFNGRNLHLFTSRNIEQERLDYVFRGIRSRSKNFGFSREDISYKVHRSSLLQKDYEYIQGILKSRGTT